MPRRDRKDIAKILRKNKLGTSTFTEIWKDAESNIHRVDTASALKKIDLIRQEGGLNRYVFRNEARVGDIIKQVLLSSIEILPFFLSLEVVENLDVRIPSEDKAKARMRVDYAVVFKDQELVNLELVQKKKERLAQSEQSINEQKPLNEISSNITPVEEAKVQEDSNSKQRKRKPKKK